MVQRLHRSWYPAVVKKLKPAKPNLIDKLLQEVRNSMNLVSRLKEIDDLEALNQKGRAKAQLMPIVDHQSKLVVGPSDDTESRISYSEKGAKENVHMESFNGRFKQGNRDLFWDQDDLESLKKVVAERIRYYYFVHKY